MRASKGTGIDMKVIIYQSRFNKSWCVAATGQQTEAFSDPKLAIAYGRGLLNADTVRLRVNLPSLEREMKRARFEVLRTESVLP